MTVANAEGSADMSSDAQKHCVLFAALFDFVLVPTQTLLTEPGHGCADHVEQGRGVDAKPDHQDRQHGQHENA